MKAHACSICGTAKTENQRWFLIAENRWRDRLRIFSWNDDMANGNFISCACSADHVRDFLQDWVTSSELPPTCQTAHFFPPEEARDHIHHLGSLWIHRHGLQDTPEGVRSLLDAIHASLRGDSKVVNEQFASKIVPQKLSLQAIAARAS